MVHTTYHRWGDRRNFRARVLISLSSNDDACTAIGIEGDIQIQQDYSSFPSPIVCIRVQRHIVDDALAVHI